MNIPSAGGQGVYVGGEGTGAQGRQQPGVVELIDQLRDEFEAVAQEIKAYRGLRDEFQRKAEEQVRLILIYIRNFAGVFLPLGLVVGIFFGGAS